MGVSEEELVKLRHEYELEFRKWALDVEIAVGFGTAVALLTACAIAGWLIAVEGKFSFNVQKNYAPICVIVTLLGAVGAGIMARVFWPLFAVCFFYKPPTCHTCLKCREQLTYEDKTQTLEEHK